MTLSLSARADATEKQPPASQYGQREVFSAKTARDVFSGFEQRLLQGDFSPFKKRLTEDERIKSHRNLIKARGIRYAACSLDNFEIAHNKQREAMATIRGYASHMDEHLTNTNGGGLVLIGPAGTGKDHLLMAVMTIAILDFGFSCIWSDGIRMYHSLKNAISTNNTEREIVKYTQPQILAISDPLPPRDELSTYEMACLRDIIDQRYSSGLSTWMTTNLQSGEEARQKLTGPILGRICHNATEINCEWPGYRKPHMSAT